MKFWRVDHTEPTGERIASWYPNKRAAQRSCAEIEKVFGDPANIDMRLVEIPMTRADLLKWLNLNAGGQTI